MPKLVFLTGFSGSGKTTAAVAWCPPALRIDGDSLFSSALMELRPELDLKRRNEWDEWPAGRRDEATASHILGTIIERAAPGLRAHAGHIIADGAIFVFDWFRKPLRGVLAVLGHSFADGDVHHLHANLPDAELFRNILCRAESVSGRGHELEIYRDVKTLARRRAEFEGCFGASRPLWDEATSSIDLNAKFASLLAG